MERWYQFRHREQGDLWGKPAVVVSVGGAKTDPVTRVLEQFCMYNLIKVMDRAEGFGANGCYYCGYGETCRVGAVVAKYGEGFKITEETIPAARKDPACMENACRAGRNLGKILTEGHDREKAAQDVRTALAALRSK